ncbi:hypothetical protein MuYL_2828 [Mucilaginibacter xinganensis]|uniref:Uncharacterized protein n=1 Tax=Mucilaginibacter xinganensis TaxID=1234841 RepID=A0A223NXY4_9SPHI|nr:hypothetical protein MuYL_2828 [Mucilaginibacter xinganensis]
MLSGFNDRYVPAPALSANFSLMNSFDFTNVKIFRENSKSLRLTGGF